ncbi:hypothetical protein AS54_1934 [Bacillus cereus 03BB102]|nr:hypothetical protein AS54_1934 [Bacillus cereus 03BB102]
MNMGESEPVAMTNPELYNAGSLALLNELDPGFSKMLQQNPGALNINIFKVEGNQVSKYDFSNAKLDASNHGQMVIGENQTVSQNIQKSKTATQTLLEELEKTDLKQETKQEMKEAIEAAEQQVESEKPNKFVLKGIVDGLKEGIDLVTKSPALITAFETWRTAISSFM